MSVKKTASTTSEKSPLLVSDGTHATPSPATSLSAPDGARKPNLELTLSPFDARDFLRHVLVLGLCAPCGFGWLSYVQCMLLIGGYVALPRIVRVWYPTFNTVNVLDDLRIQAGASLSLFGSLTALLLQSHNTSISLAVKFHSEFYSRPLTRLLRTYLYVEMALNSSSTEKEQTASWLRWMHRHIHGSITPELREELGIPDNVDEYGYIDELKAYIMETLTWATISFQTRFGRRLSQRAKDTITLEYTCAGLRLGVPEEMLTKDYESFLVSFNKRLDLIDAGYDLTRNIVENVERSVLEAKKSWVTAVLVRAALMVGHSLLPDRVKDKYQLKILSTRLGRVVQRVLCALLWVVYPSLMWIPLRGMICLLLVLEPQLRPVFLSSLQAIHSMDILLDKPVYSKSTNNGDAKSSAVQELPSYISWLESGKDDRPLLQVILVRVLEAQISPRQFKSWTKLPFRITYAIYEAASNSIQKTVLDWRTQIAESRLFQGKAEAKLPEHIGFVMDGNRRYARAIGQPIIIGHTKGAETASKILEWWLRFIPNTAGYASGALPRYLTVWAFSSENFSRADEEREGLFQLMAAEFKSLAFTSIVHLFQIRVRVIGGQRHRLPMELLETIDMLEETTAMYDHLFLQIAVGYGGRDEIVTSVRRLIDQGTEVTEKNIGMETACGKINVPPVDMIVRTSERRTSGFLLWDTQGAELHFIQKLWPQLTEMDWLDALSSFGGREMRWGK